LKTITKDELIEVIQELDFEVAHFDGKIFNSNSQSPDKFKFFENLQTFPYKVAPIEFSMRIEGFIKREVL